MTPAQKIKAVVFDLDGTLLHTIPDLAASVNATLRQAGLPEHTLAEITRYIGNGVRKLIQRAAPEGSSEQEIDALVAWYRAYYPQHCTELTDYFPGISALLERLQAEGYRLGVFSNKTEATAVKVMDHYFPGIDFAFVWGNNGQRPLKPAPDAGTLICSRLELEPAQIAFVGDGDTDMAFASALGFRALGVTWGYRGRDELLAAGAEQLADDCQQLYQQIVS